MQCAATNPVPPVTSTTSPLMCPPGPHFTPGSLHVRGLTVWDDGRGDRLRPRPRRAAPCGPGAPGGPSQCAGAGHSMPYEREHEHRERVDHDRDGEASEADADHRDGGPPLSERAVARHRHAAEPDGDRAEQHQPRRASVLPVERDDEAEHHGGHAEPERGPAEEARPADPLGGALAISRPLSHPLDHRRGGRSAQPRVGGGAPAARPRPGSCARVRADDASGPASEETGPPWCDQLARIRSLRHVGFVTSTVMVPPVFWPVTVTDTPWPAT